MKSPTLARTELFVTFIVEDCARIADQAVAHATAQAKRAQAEGKSDSGWLSQVAVARSIAEDIRAMLKSDD